MTCLLSVKVSPLQLFKWFNKKRHSRDIGIFLFLDIYNLQFCQRAPSPPKNVCYFPMVQCYHFMKFPPFSASCQASAEHSNARLLPEPVGLSNRQFWHRSRPLMIYMEQNKTMEGWLSDLDSRNIPFHKPYIIKGVWLDPRIQQHRNRTAKATHAACNTYSLHHAELWRVWLVREGDLHTLYGVLHGHFHAAGCVQF